MQTHPSRKTHSSRRTPAATSRLSLLVLFVILLSLTACDSDSNAPVNQRMNISTGQFERGYKDGLREGESSLFEDNGAWMWLWMMETEYQSGYKQGYTEGRARQKYNNPENPNAQSNPDHRKGGDLGDTRGKWTVQ